MWKSWEELDSEEENKKEVIDLTSNREEGRNSCFIRQMEALIKDALHEQGMILNQVSNKLLTTWFVRSWDMGEDLICWRAIELRNLDNITYFSSLPQTKAV